MTVHINISPLPLSFFNAKCLSNCSWSNCLVFFSFVFVLFLLLNLTLGLPLLLTLVSAPVLIQPGPLCDVSTPTDLCLTHFLPVTPALSCVSVPDCVTAACVCVCARFFKALVDTHGLTHRPHPVTRERSRFTAWKRWTA